MKRLFHLQLVVICLIATTGCATSGYWSDRGLDAADILTATVGKGAALGARVGPVKVALNYHEDYAGLRNGNFFVSGQQDGEELDILIFGVEESVSLRNRGKDYFAHTVAFLTIPGMDGGYIFPDSNLTPHYFTQIQASVGLGGTLRIGVNPGELLDFILGWTTIDIYNDDIATTPNE